MMNAKPGRVYVMAAEGRVKIGRSNNPELRHRMLQASTPAHLTLVHSTPERTDSSYVEAAAHRLLADKRKAGEWFDVTPDEAIAAIEIAIEEVERKKLEPKKPKLIRAPSRQCRRLGPSVQICVRFPLPMLDAVREIQAQTPGATFSSVVVALVGEALQAKGKRK